MNEHTAWRDLISSYTPQELEEIRRRAYLRYRVERTVWLVTGWDLVDRRWRPVEWIRELFGRPS